MVPYSHAQANLITIRRLELETGLLLKWLPAEAAEEVEQSAPTEQRAVVQTGCVQMPGDARQVARPAATGSSPTPCSVGVPLPQCRDCSHTRDKIKNGMCE